VQKHLTINKCCAFHTIGLSGRVALISMFICIACIGNGRVFAELPSMPVIVIDPGHGGVDKGAQSTGGLEEKQVCQRLAGKLESLLEKNARIVMTRSEDYGVSLFQRASLANHSKGDLFISLHAGAGFLKSSNGHGIYYDLPHIKGSGIENVKKKQLQPDWDHVQHGHVNLSARLSESLRKYLSEIDGHPDPHVLQAPMLLLHGLDMPAVIYETGYLTNPAMAARLEDEKYLDLLARALADGILEFLAKEM